MTAQLKVYITTSPALDALVGPGVVPEWHRQMKAQGYRATPPKWLHRIALRSRMG
jgi:hypothetical protein